MSGYFNSWKKKGIIENETRSGLWFEMFRAIRILQPKFAIIENVSAITIRGLDIVLSSLAEIGYDAEWQNIRASDMGAPHRRERIWIIAYPESIGIKALNTQAKINTKSSRETPADWSNFFFQSHGNNKIEFFEKYKSRIYRDGSWLPEDVDRLKGLGNSIVPQIAKLLFEQIKPFCDFDKNQDYNYYMNRG